MTFALPKVMSGADSLEGAEDRAANTTYSIYFGTQNIRSINVYILSNARA